MTTLNRLSDTLSDTVKGTLDVLADGWQELWHKARSAITHYTPATEGKEVSAGRGNRWGVLTAELHESPGEIFVELEAPGMDKNNFEIFVKGNALVVRGKKVASSERTQGHYHITERAYGRFERAFHLPVEVDEGKTEATYNNGVLKIHLPKLEEAKPRVISIS